MGWLSGQFGCRARNATAPSCVRLLAGGGNLEKRITLLNSRRCHAGGRVPQRVPRYCWIISPITGLTGDCAILAGSAMQLLDLRLSWGKTGIGGE
jgi:hypothetical protein